MPLPPAAGRGSGAGNLTGSVLGGGDLYHLAHTVEAGVVGLLADEGTGVCVDGDDAAVHQVVVLHAIHALGHVGVGQVGSLRTEVGVVHAAGGIGAVADEGVSAGVVGDAVFGKIFIDSQLCGHDDVIGRSKHGVHTGSDQGGGGSNYFIVGIGGLFNVLDALSIQIGLGVGNGLGRVGFRQGVQQADLCGVGILGEHHIHDEVGIQGVAGAGDTVDPGQLGGLRVGDCGVDHRGLGLLGGEGGDLGGGGGDGDDGIHAVGNGLVAQLLENGLVALTGGDLVFDLHILIGGDLIQLRGDGVGNLVQRGVVQLLDDGDLVGLGIGFGGRGGVLVGRAVGGGFGLAAAGSQRQGHGTGKSHGQELLHHVVLHFGFLQKYKMFEWQMTVLAVPGPNGNKKQPSPHSWDKS